MKPQSSAVDNFAGWNDNVEGAERPQSAGIIQGALVKFTNGATWLTNDDDEVTSDLELIAADVIRVVQRWEDGKPVKTKILEPSEPFPDIEAMNEAVPRDEWIDGPNGPRGPWQAQHLVYLLDPASMEKFAFATGTTGGRIAVRELVDKTVWMRRTRGPNVYPVVTLSDTHMNTRYGGRQRPHFKIVKWTRLGGEGGEELAALPAPKPVSEPTLAEEMNDSVDDLFVAPPEKKPAKANGKRSKSEAA
jgi:hypothetical protein